MDNLNFTSRIKNAWNAFRNRDPTHFSGDYGYANAYRPDISRLSRGNERSIVAAVLNRIAMDVAQLEFKHVQLDDQMRYLSDIDSGLNECLTVSANIDQTGRDLIHDMVMSMCSEGCVVLVPVDTDVNPTKSGFDILSLRTGKVTQWYPKDVKVNLYNEATGKREDIILPKSMVTIIPNPFYSVMNEPNSTLQRLIRKLNLLDAIDEQSGSGKLDLIIQLPYAVKSETRKQQAEMRRKDLEDQLRNSKYGIGYTDATEHITQLNRPVENNLMHQIEYLTNMLFSQLGITQSIMDGTANAETMLNYYNRVVEPIASAITDEMKRKFLSKEDRNNLESVMFFRDPFRLVPTKDIPEIADKFTRNEILTSNEIRQIIGRKPSSDPKADELRNSNIKMADGEEQSYPFDFAKEE